MSLFHDWRNQISWGRVCAAVALVMAVLRECRGADVYHVALWLMIATGNYGLSKLTEPGGFGAIFQKFIPVAAGSAPNGNAASSCAVASPSVDGGNQ